MKKILLFGALGLLTFPVFAFAAAPPTPIRTELPREIGVPDAINLIFGMAFWLLLAIAGLFFLMGAYYFLMGGQDPKNADKGKSVITWAVVALVVAILARGLAAFIPRMFGIT